MTKVTLRHLFLRDRMLMSRFGLVIASMLWAIQLALPVELFPTAQMIVEGKGRTTYALMAIIAPEWLWATLFAVHALFASYTLFTETRNHVTLACDGFLGCVLWTSATFACYAAHWPHTGSFLGDLAAYPTPAAMSADLVMAFYAWWHMVRFWAEEETHQHCVAPQKEHQSTFGS